MAFDGLTIKAIVNELNQNTKEARFFKIAEPEKDELLITIKTKNGQRKLLISASATLPLIYFTEKSRTSPLTAPNFCMLLRKYIANAKIISISQPSLERIIDIELEHYNDLGDLCRKHLIVELMGKHSNIIFTDDKNMIVDSIKHIGANVSSVREVLPGRDYFIAGANDKLNPFEVDEDSFVNIVCEKPLNISKAIYTSITGFSPLIANEIAYRAGLDADMPVSALKDVDKMHLYNIFSHIVDDLRNNDYKLCVVFDEDASPLEYSVIELSMYKDKRIEYYDSISELLEDFYAKKESSTRIRQRSSDLRQIVQTALNKNNKKYDLQLLQLKDTEKRDKFRIYGELLTTYGYNIEAGVKSAKVLNYYSNEEINIPLDPDLSAIDNAKKYFDKYAKLKRTYEALTEIIVSTKEEIDHLESVKCALDLAENEEDLKELKEELISSGYIRRKAKDKAAKINIKPLHYISSDGYDIYVGKNNLQNEYVTFKLAEGGDWWFHAKGVPGSHVIVKAAGKELPDKTYEEAGRLAAYYSKSRGNDKVDIDYSLKKNIKKPAGKKPGFVIYHTNYSLTIDSNIDGIKLCE
ncbi:MAG: fibronectin/fibrinogen-binding protein [Lachnospiraceae bacterium]|nr:fibronectin/fibrinogen-binding protein [Lachnospiraceae bacterium]